MTFSGQKNSGGLSVKLLGNFVSFRGMEYCCEFFAGLVKDFEACQQQKAEGKDGKGDNNVIKKLLQAAYDLTLTKYHGMASRLMMKVWMHWFR